MMKWLLVVVKKKRILVFLSNQWNEILDKRISNFRISSDRLFYLRDWGFKKALIDIKCL